MLNLAALADDLPRDSGSAAPPESSAAAEGDPPSSADGTGTGADSSGHAEEAGDEEGEGQDTVGTLPQPKTSPAGACCAHTQPPI